MVDLRESVELLAAIAFAAKECLLPEYKNKLSKDIDYALAQVNEALDAYGWLPLPATPEPGVAPWDGKFVDLWDPLTGSRITDCSWVEFDSYWDSPEGYILDNGQPTHWMPLPNPPPAPGERG